jgi:hypothetical protein
LSTRSLCIAHCDAELPGNELRLRVDDLRWRSVIPASVAHGFWNILVASEVGGSSPWSSDFALVSWTVAGLVLHRFWPLPDGYSEPEPLAASRTSVS